MLEEGDPVEMEVTEEGILIRPKKEIDATQAWFWTPEWQAGEAEATEDGRLGRYDVYDDTESFLRALEEHSKS